jgi:hypothetical protein
VAEEIELSTLRKDIETALRKEHERQTRIAIGMRTGTAPREVVKAKLTLLEEYIELCEDDDLNIIMKVEREFPENGRIRL